MIADAIGEAIAAVFQGIVEVVLRTLGRVVVSVSGSRTRRLREKHPEWVESLAGLLALLILLGAAGWIARLVIG